MLGDVAAHAGQAVVARADLLRHRRNHSRASVGRVIKRERVLDLRFGQHGEVGATGRGRSGWPRRRSRSNKGSPVRFSNSPTTTTFGGEGGPARASRARPPGPRRRAAPRPPAAAAQMPRAPTPRRPPGASAARSARGNGDGAPAASGLHRLSEPVALAGLGGDIACLPAGRPRRAPHLRRVKMVWLMLASSTTLRDRSWRPSARRATPRGRDAPPDRAGSPGPSETGRRSRSHRRGSGRGGSDPSTNGPKP